MLLGTPCSLETNTKKKFLSYVSLKPSPNTQGLGAGDFFLNGMQALHIELFDSPIVHRSGKHQQQPTNE
jgi:hypothetical protein